MHSFRLQNVALCILFLLWVDSLNAKSSVKGKSGSAKIAASSKPDMREVTLEKDGKEVVVTLKKLDNKSAKVPKGISDKNVLVFWSEDNDVICMDTCDGTLEEDGQCTGTEGEPRCMESQGNYTYYYTDTTAIEMEGDGEEGMLVEMTDMKLYNDTKNSTANANTRRKRKATKLLTPRFNNQNVGIINLLHIVDAAFMEQFKAAFNNDLTITRQEVIRFLFFLNIRVSLYLHTLAEHKVKYETTDGFTYPVDLTAFAVDFILPQDNGTHFVDPDPTASNRYGDEVRVYQYFYENQYLGMSGILADWAFYLRATYGASKAFNLVMIHSGYDLVLHNIVFYSNGTVRETIEPRVVGVAFIRQLCIDWEPFPYDLRFTHNEFIPVAYAALVAHEIGHNIGCFHDENETCPSSAHTIMAPYLTPKTLEKPDYSKFSICSAVDVATHLRRFSSNTIAECLYTYSPTKEEFLDDFCQGLIGYEYGLNLTCGIFFGTDSYACENGESVLQNGYLASDNCATYVNEENQYETIFNCSNKDTGCDGTTNRIIHVFDGTKCANPSGHEGKKVCFDGECRAQVNLCNRKNVKNN